MDAVRCAVEIQEELRVRNAELPENRRMEFRIGINLGDVVEEGERIYGDGVNITARVEGLAEGGGICISGTVYDSIKNKLSLSYESLGEHTVKNIAEPVRVYRMRIGPEAAGPVEREEKKRPRRWRWAAIGGATVLIIIAGGLAIWNFYFRPAVEPASVEKMAFPLPDEPSIAVLPFTNVSGDPQQDSLSDGLTVQIITNLSMVPRLFVIARNSTFTYKGKAVKVQQVAEEMGVRYVLEGSVQKAGEKLRITAQLIDALTGRYVWAERYDRELKDIFALQDEITKKILTALQVKLTSGEAARVIAKGTDNLEAYIKVMQGYDYYFRFNEEGILHARQLAEKAIALDPEYASAYCLLGQTHLIAPYFGLSKSPRKSYQESARLLQKALAFDESHPIASSVLAVVYGRQRQHEKSLAQAERAVALYPNMAVSNVNLGAALFRLGRYEEAIQSLEKGIRLNPKGPVPFFTFLGWAYCFAGRYEDAIATLKKAIDLAPDSPIVHTHLAAIYSLSGLEKEARAEVAEVLRLNPKFSIERYGKVMAWRKAELEPWLAALRKAGLPETPPLPLPDKPSIAVLPFVNMSGDPEQEYFSDGITEEIITALSKVPDLFVIARNSSFTYKGKSVRIPTVGRELGVRYVLEGSVRKAADKVRITAQLVDAKTGKHVWAERYDRELKDIFAIQDEITMKIITELQVKLTEGEQARLSAKGTENLEAYLRRSQAKKHVRQVNKEDNALGRKLAEGAISLDPEYADAYVTLGSTHWMDIVLGSSQSPEESLKRAFELTKKAIALDDSNVDAHVSLSWLFVFSRQHDKGVAEAERAVGLAPGSAYTQFNMGRVLRFAGRPEEAIAWHKKAIRHDPVPDGPVLFGLCHAYWFAGRCEEAVPVCKKAIRVSPNNMGAHLYLTGTYVSLGRIEEARTQAQEVLRIDPKFSLERYAKTQPYKNQADTESFIDAIRKAGLK
ncbi:MAG: tetratricopeptide repeat protein [Promethearchaeota archaeon]